MPPDLPFKQISQLCRLYPVRRLSLFGSALGDRYSPDSDIDLLVEFDSEAQITYLDLADIQIALTNIIGRNIDLVTAGALSDYFHEHVLESAEVIYEHE